MAHAAEGIPLTALAEALSQASVQQLERIVIQIGTHIGGRNTVLLAHLFLELAQREETSAPSTVKVKIVAGANHQFVVQAVKLIREVVGCTLIEAKQAMDGLACLTLHDNALVQRLATGLDKYGVTVERL